MWSDFRPQNNCVKIRSSVYAVALLKNQKNEQKIVTPEARQNHVFEEQKKP